MIKFFLMTVTIRPLTFFLLCLLLLPAARVSGAERPRIAFLGPETRTASFSLPIVISLGKASPAGIKLSVNGRPVRIKPQRGAATANVSLAPGRNVITLEKPGKVLDRKEVEVVRDGKQDGLFAAHPGPSLVDNCQQCHPRATRGNFSAVIQKKNTCVSSSCHPTIGKKRHLHGPVKQGSCLPCHNPHGSDTPKFTAAEREKLCFRCHTDLESQFDRKVVHFPVKKGECLACHDPHGSEQRFHLKRKTIRGLCAGCHGDRQSQHPNLHEPVAEGDCIACHDPHVADYPGLLPEKGNDLCFTCHEVRKEEFNSLHVHKPVREGCINCHDPHGSAAPNHLKTDKDENGAYLKGEKPVRDFCLTCHEKLNPKISAAILGAKFSHQPVAEGNCITCHTPHSTNFPKQLKDFPSNLCYGCHKKMGKKIKEAKYRHGPIRRGNCAQCHQVHGAEREHLLVAEFSTDFYGDFDPNKYALCFSCHNKRVFTEAENSETEFRNGNRSLHFAHVNRKNGRGCRGCHDIHASNQPRHIRKKSVFRGKYKVKINFKPTSTGGTCIVGCHRPRKYDREKPVQYR